MLVQGPSHLTACLWEATQEETTATVRERAQASNPPTEQGRGATRSTGVLQDPIGQVVEGEDGKDIEEIRWSKEQMKKVPTKKKLTKEKPTKKMSRKKKRTKKESRKKK